MYTKAKKQKLSEQFQILYKQSAFAYDVVLQIGKWQGDEVTSENVHCSLQVPSKHPELYYQNKEQPLYQALSLGEGS